MDTIRVSGPRPSNVSTNEPSFEEDDDTAGVGRPPHRHILRLIEDQGQIGFWWHDVASDEITVSPGLARITGIPTTVRRTRESMMQAIHPRDRMFQDDLLGIVDLGQPLRREFRIIRPEGTIRWVSCKIDVVVGEDGRPIRFIGILVDITERREALRVVEYNQDRRIALLEAVSAQTWLANARGECIDFSAFCRLTGQTPEECKGDGWTRAIHPDDRERVLLDYRTAICGGSRYEAEYRIKAVDGSYLRIIARAAPVKDRSGTILEWQGVTQPLDPIYGADTRPGEEAELTPLTGAQIRGARGLLDWSLAQLASASGVSVSTIKRMEDGNESSTRPSKSDAVRRALQSSGIAFRVIDGVTWISK